MDLLVIRHGQAEPHGDAAGDAARRLTDDGRKKMRRGARGLRRLVPELDALVASPLVRAVETAEIVSEAYDGLAIEQTPLLVPEGEPKELAEWLAQRTESRLALVGHEPLLSHAASFLLAGVRTSFLQLKTGGACLLTFDEPVGAGRARLVFLATPWQLRKLR
jgi:phosphohistidine phosphatase